MECYTSTRIKATNRFHPRSFGLKGCFLLPLRGRHNCGGAFKGGVGHHADGDGDALDYPFGVGHTLVKAGTSFAGVLRQSIRRLVSVTTMASRGTFLLPRVMFAVGARSLGRCMGRSIPSTSTLIAPRKAKANSAKEVIGRLGEYALPPREIFQSCGWRGRKSILREHLFRLLLPWGQVRRHRRT